MHISRQCVPHWARFRWCIANSVVDTITITADFNATAQIAINDGVTIQGGGYKITRADTGVLHRFFKVDTDKTLTIKDLTLHGGAVESEWDQGDIDDGGAIYVLGTLVATNVRFEGNIAYAGAGVFVKTGGEATFTTCTFVNNTASLGSGGGVFVNGDATATFTTCAFSSNSANFGGGVAMGTRAAATFNDCAFNSNSATTNGGGVVVGGTATFTTCAFVNNTASLGSGGGVMVYGNGVTTFYNTAWTGCTGQNCDTCDGNTCEGKDKCAFTCFENWDLNPETDPTDQCSCADISASCGTGKYCDIDVGTCISGPNSIGEKCSSGCNNECISGHCSDYMCVNAGDLAIEATENAELTNVTYTCLVLQLEYNKGCCDNSINEISLPRFPPTAAPTATP